MPLYKITTEDKIENIKRIPFTKEKDLQLMVEKNIEIFFGLRFLETEYSIPNGRIDSLCIDESGTPVIIEYKKKKDLSAIIQGLFYIDWLRSNRRTFEMIVNGKIKDGEVDWRTTPRLLIIAEEFDQKETVAINQINASVELIKYSYYGGFISFDQLNFSKSISNYSNIATISDQGSTKILSETEVPNLENVINKGSIKIQEIITLLRDYIFEISDEIDEQVKSSMIAYYSNNKGMLWIEPGVHQCVIRLRKGFYQDSKNFIKENGLGGYPLVKINEKEYNIEVEEYVKDLIKQAYNN